MAHPPSHDRLPAIIADDFTGAMDSGVQFARYGIPARLLLHGLIHLDPSQVVVINTNSRDGDPDTAAEHCRTAASALAGRALFKKIDSTMRGHIGVEISALLAATGYTKAVICPAVPLQGRGVRDGILYVHGVPLHETAFHDDPLFPARTSRLVELTGRPTTHLPSGVLNRTPQDVAAAITAAPTEFVTVDAETNEDLMRLHLACRGQNFLLCGAFGLVSAWARTLVDLDAPEPAPALLNTSERVLIVSGSASPVSRAQVERLSVYRDVHLVPVDAEALSRADQIESARNKLLHEIHQYPGKGDAPPPTRIDRPGARITALYPAAGETLRAPGWTGFSRLVSSLAVALIARRRPDLLVVIGGETAGYLFDALNVEAVELIGEAAPGLPCGRLIGGPSDGLVILTKAGGFGSPDSLEKILFPPSAR